MRVRILSRASDLARIQALLVARALEARWPDLDVTLLTRTAAGDRDVVTPLASLPDKGVFTADLSDALVRGDAELVVHSWKDLPLEGRPDTTIAATLERADPRDVLLIRRDVVARRPPALDVLSSSPRRAYLLESLLPALLPWRVNRVRFSPVRGNVATRLRKLIEGRADALVVAKAALDRLLSFGPPFDVAAVEIKRVLDQCQWMVLPIRDVPGAPAQGALAVEIAKDNATLRDRVSEISHAPTWNAVMRERDVLASYGGGCHEAIGATVLPREYGQVESIRGRSRAGVSDEGWSLVNAGPTPPRAPIVHIWPRPDERDRGVRRVLDVAQPQDDAGYWVARADALPEQWTISPDRIVWAAGGKTWRRLAARGVWAHGCADGLGDGEAPNIDALTGAPVRWHRLTHESAAAAVPDALATYGVDDPLPPDLSERTHFFWTSGSRFTAAIARWPGIREGWHGSGPGRTLRVLRETLGPDARVCAWLDYDHWHKEIAL